MKVFALVCSLVSIVAAICVVYAILIRMDINEYVYWALGYGVFCAIWGMAGGGSEIDDRRSSVGPSLILIDILLVLGHAGSDRVRPFSILLASSLLLLAMIGLHQIVV